MIGRRHVYQYLLVLMGKGIKFFFQLKKFPLVDILISI